MVLRRLADGTSRHIAVGTVPIHDRERTLRMARLHMDSTRLASLFAERMILVEGVSDAIIVRQLGAVWAAGDPVKAGFIDALTITVVGSKIGRWPIDSIATPGHELVDRLALYRHRRALRGGAGRVLHPDGSGRP